MSFLSDHKLTIFGILAGAVGGFLYWQQVGCVSGQCAITSDPIYSSFYGAALGGLLFNIFKSRKVKAMETEAIQNIIRSKQGTVLDVRSRGEFQGGHVAGSVNIPLQEIPEKLNDIKKLQAPIVLCCASGVRSSQAHRVLSQQNIESYNAGSWFDVNRMQSETK